MYVNRSAIVNHDIIVAIYIIRLAPINRLGEFLIFHSSVEEILRRRIVQEGRGASGSGSSRILHEHATSRARVFQVQRRRSLLEVEFFYVSFLSLSLQARMRSTLRCSHRASALTVAPSTWIGTYSIFCTPGKFGEEIIEELEKKIRFGNFAGGIQIAEQRWIFRIRIRYEGVISTIDIRP